MKQNKTFYLTHADAQVVVEQFTFNVYSIGFK